MIPDGEQKKKKLSKHKLSLILIKSVQRQGSNDMFLWWCRLSSSPRQNHFSEEQLLLQSAEYFLGCLRPSKTGISAQLWTLDYMVPTCCLIMCTCINLRFCFFFLKLWCTFKRRNLGSESVIFTSAKGWRSTSALRQISTPYFPATLLNARLSRDERRVC